MYLVQIQKKPFVKVKKYEVFSFILNIWQKLHEFLFDVMVLLNRLKKYIY